MGTLHRRLVHDILVFVYQTSAWTIFKDHFSNMTEKKESLLKELYVKLKSPEFNCLKEINQIMMKQQDLQEEHNKMSLKNQSEYLEISRQALDIQQQTLEQNKQLQESFVNTLITPTITRNNTIIQVNVHNNNVYLWTGIRALMVST